MGSDKTIKGKPSSKPSEKEEKVRHKKEGNLHFQEKKESIKKKTIFLTPPMMGKESQIKSLN